MHVLLVNALSWLVRHLLSLLLIIALLLMGRAVWAQWRDWQLIREESVLLNKGEPKIRGSLEELEKSIKRRAGEFRGARLAALQKRKAEVDSEIGRMRKERQELLGVKAMLKSESLTEVYLNGLQIDGAIWLLEQERAWLEGTIDLEGLRQTHENVYQSLLKSEQQLAALQARHPIKVHVPGTAENQGYKKLDSEVADRRRKNKDAHDAYERRKASLNGSAPWPNPLPQDAVTALLKPLSDRMNDLRKRERDNWVHRLEQPVQEVLPSALLIMLGAIVTPFGIKAVFYFLLAPLASRCPPMRLLPNDGGLVTLDGHTSSVSRAIKVDPEHELLVHPQFLQSSSVAGEKSTQWVLDWGFMITSLSAGMVALTRIRCDLPEEFVISSTRNALAEIGVLDLQAGSALVLQPHNLVGVVQRRDVPLRITAHWRLTSLHAWLTLQLRYLVLHGPARLIVQGCRGVKVELARGGRTINQAATIAFSANLEYSTRRCETFTAYLRGQQELLNDCFESVARDGAIGALPDVGYFVYQEMPHADRKAGITGRGLEGLTDSMLKVLGI